MIKIDGTFGEGGGQILRSSLGLSLVTGKAFIIGKIRGRRKKGGLLRQHLTAVNAAVKISNAQVKGNEIKSNELYFKPGKVNAGNYHFAVGSAGSATLVLQTILPALIVASEKSQLVLEGGTHNPYAPPFDFLKFSFLDVLKKMGAVCEARIEQYGFYPIGGGRYCISIKPVQKLKKIDLCERGEIKDIKAIALYARIPGRIAKDEVQIIKRKLGLNEKDCKIEEVASPGPGNAVMVRAQSTVLNFIGTAFGEKGRPLKWVANEAVKAAKNYLNSEAAVCEHLADQLLIPMAMAGRGSFTTVKPSMHTLTNIEVIKKFIDIDIQVIQVSDEIWRIEIAKEKENEMGI